MESHGANLMMTILDTREEMINNLYNETEKLAVMSEQLNATIENITNTVEWLLYPLKLYLKRGVTSWSRLRKQSDI